MVHVQDVVRVLTGLVLVSREAAKMDPALRRLRTGDLSGLASSTIWRVVNAATDVAGLTRGSGHQFKPSNLVSDIAAQGGKIEDVRLQSFDLPSDAFRTTGPNEAVQCGEPKALVSEGLGSRRERTFHQTNDCNSASIQSADTGRNELADANCFSGMDRIPPDELQKHKIYFHETRLQDVGELPGGVPLLGINRNSDLRLTTDHGLDDLQPVHTEDPKQDGYCKQNEQFEIGVLFPDKNDESVNVALPVSQASETEARSNCITDRSQGFVRTKKKRKPRERPVPSTPFGRAFGFARLGAGIAFGALQESAKQLWGGKTHLSGGQSHLSPFLTEQNAERLALSLCRMRGAALKLGQMLSIQDESILPPPVLAALEIVRHGADVMPARQLNVVIAAELGPDWRSKLKSFDDQPMAAASIGQVHKAVLKNGMEVAMKIQYPGVADSINSDIENARLLLQYTNLVPKGLYLDQAMKVAKEELALECDYRLEAINQKRFRELLSGCTGFYVPLVVEEFSTKRVLTTELVHGVSIDKIEQMKQSCRDYVGRQLLTLTLQELFVFHFMQTDPNWSNFLYDDAGDMINLIDFGAAREYPKYFVDNYLKMVLACANQDRDQVIEMSCRLGFLTGQETTIMLDAHTEAAFVVGLPFSRFGGFDFRTTDLTKRISGLGATMLQHRLTAPPDEAYSLHRKLSGAFLACIKLGAVVPCREMLLDLYEKYHFSNQEELQQVVHL